ncbi:hypothetical protein [Corallococcus macrosporus]|uniref:Uncharacterized protein n=1 Tax=Myxococcus fulvus (strain ATCC BAA-855 / HW-1) TaxID=483219 RepID=F8CCL4_MYXFH|nr:hypothetical protein [Corallococcus macrosporus]AEI62268.1 hypothetical protein LILAB_01685 [Corallococcus macrosporus]
MSTIRRITASISSARLDTNLESVSPLVPREPLQPVPAVRRGFADESEFQAEVDDLDTSLTAHAPKLAGLDGAQVDAEAPEHLRVFAGESSFESAPPRYSQLLGSQLPASLGAPRESVSGAAHRPSSRGPGAQDMGSDLLSPDAAAWELQHRDTSMAPTPVEAEDVLFMLDGPGAAADLEPAVELGLEDLFEEAPRLRAAEDALFSAGAEDVPAARADTEAARLAGLAPTRFDAPVNFATEAAGIDAVPADLATAAAGDARVDDAPAGFALGSAYAATYGQQFAARQALDAAVSPAGPDAFLADPLDLGTLAPDEPTLDDAAVAGVLGPISANPAAASAPVAAAFASQGVEVVAEALEPEPRPDANPGAAEALAPEEPQG